MKLIIKEQEVGKKKPLNKELILVVLVFVGVAVFVYLIATTINGQIQQNNLASFNAEAAAYGNQLTSELSINSSACQQSATSNNTNLTLACGAVFYCRYSSACESQLPNLSSKTISILCDAFKSNRVIATGMCFKQQI